MKMMLLALVLFFTFTVNCFSATDPALWKINKESLFNSDGKPKSEMIKTLLERLQSKDEPGLPVSVTELLKLLERPEANSIYIKELVKYATPNSLSIQKQEHDKVLRSYLKKKKVQEGVNFLKAHANILNKVEKEYGVYKHDIVSILMWETALGKYTGNYRVFNIFMGQVLFLDSARKYTLEELLKDGKENPLDDPEFRALDEKRVLKRKEYALKSLSALLRYCKLYNLDPLSQKGSWGGAIGYVQFMPFNLNYAVDADKDGVIDLFEWNDAIHSAANYLKQKGNYSKDNKGRRAAIFSYNHSDEYVNGVILYAEAISKKLKK